MCIQCIHGVYLSLWCALHHVHMHESAHQRWYLCVGFWRGFIFMLRMNEYATTHTCMLKLQLSYTIWQFEDTSYLFHLVWPVYSKLFLLTVQNVTYGYNLFIIPLVAFLKLLKFFDLVSVIVWKTDLVMDDRHKTKDVMDCFLQVLPIVSSWICCFQVRSKLLTQITTLSDR